MRAGKTWFVVSSLQYRVCVIRLVTIAGLLLPMIAEAKEAQSVSGYRNIRFGMTRAQVRATKACVFLDSDGDDLQCSGLKFDGPRGATSALTLFVFGGERLQSIRILAGQGTNDAFRLAKSLANKYGRGIWDPDEKDAQFREFKNHERVKVEYPFLSGAVVLTLVWFTEETLAVFVSYNDVRDLNL